MDYVIFKIQCNNLIILFKLQLFITRYKLHVYYFLSILDKTLADVYYPNFYGLKLPEHVFSLLSYTKN